MAFDVGDKVVYPHHGAATIEKREKKEAFGEKRDYLVLRLAYGDLTLMVPADNAEEIGLRDVINDEEVEEVFAVLRKKEARMPTNWSRRFKNHVEKLKSGDIYQVAEVVRNLSIREADKGLSAGEKRMLARARQILVSELTFALNVDEEAAEARLDAVLKGEDQPPAPKKAKAPAEEEGRGEVVGPCRSGRSSSPRGRGVRFGAAAGTPDGEARKQFVELGGVSVVERAVRTSTQCCDGVVLVLPADVVAADVDSAARAPRRGRGGRRDPRRLRACRPRGRCPRPPTSSSCTTRRVRSRRLRCSPRWSTPFARVPMPRCRRLPVTDTVKRVVGDRVEATVARDDLVAVQTPQAFRAAALRAAHAGAPDASDDAALVERRRWCSRRGARRGRQPEDHDGGRPRRGRRVLLRERTEGGTR